MSVVADASWIIALQATDDPHHKAAIRSNERLESEVILLAPITLAECLIGPTRRGQADAVEATLRAAFTIAVDDGSAPARWARARVESGLKMADAIVLETARRENATGVATFDDRLAAAARKSGLNVFGRN